MAYHLKRTDKSINARLVKLKLRKIEQKEKYKKGDIPWNKGITYTLEGKMPETKIPVKINEKAIIYVNDVNKIKKVKKLYSKLN